MRHGAVGGVTLGWYVGGGGVNCGYGFQTGCGLDGVSVERYTGTFHG